MLRVVVLYSYRFQMGKIPGRCLLIGLRKYGMIIRKIILRGGSPHLEGFQGSVRVNPV
jgi:hypothetical protein